MADVGANGEFTLNKDFFVKFPAGYRSHQIRLEGGDCSTDAFVFHQFKDGSNRNLGGPLGAVILSGVYHG